MHLDVSRLELPLSSADSSRLSQLEGRRLCLEHRGFNDALGISIRIS